MKGLLLKDWYMAKKYCRSYLLIAVVFIAASFFGRENMFFVFYPCLLCGMIPVTLLAYDERSHWLEYSGTLPYSKAQLVSGKYLLGLIAQFVMLIVTGIAQAIRMRLSGGFDAGSFFLLMGSIFAMSALASSISMPFMFKLGVEKGRIAYYVMIGVVCAGGLIASGLFTSGAVSDVRSAAVCPALILVGLGVYFLSWSLSTALFEKREIC